MQARAMGTTDSWKRLGRPFVLANQATSELSRTGRPDGRGNLSEKMVGMAVVRGTWW